MAAASASRPSASDAVLDPLAEPAPAAPVSSRPTSAATPGEAPRQVILDVRNLRTYFFTYDGVVKALDGVSFNVRRGETLGLVGETGCGKSVTAFSITRLIPDPPGRIMDGTILFKGANLLWGVDREAKYKPVKKTNRVKVTRRFRRIKANLERMTAVRGGGVSMIFQEPTSALNPIFSISDQISEAVLLHRGEPTIRELLNADINGFNTQAILTDVTRLDKLGDGPSVRRAVERLRLAIRRSLTVAPDAARPPLQQADALLTDALEHATTVGEFDPPEKQKVAIQQLRAAMAKARPVFQARSYANEQIQKRETYVRAAIDEAIRVARKNDPAALRTAADAVGKAAELSTLGTEVYYLLRNAWSDPEAKRPDIEKAVQRLRLSNFQRYYLRRERRLYELDRELKATFLGEMRVGKVERGRRRILKSRRSALRLRTAFFGLWGLRGRVKRPLKQETFWRTVQLLEGVSIANPVQVARGYPHELSGGMLQRVMIAMALSAEPELLVADEPTTALDVTIQAQILSLMRELKDRVGTAILLITHDLGVIAEVADRVAVMYAGNVVELGGVKEIFRRPLHPYTQGLLSSIPRMDEPDKKLESIPGSVPNLIYPPSGCRFHPRCPHAMPICKESRPPMTVEGEGHTVACYLYNGPVWKG